MSNPQGTQLTANISLINQGRCVICQNCGHLNQMKAAFCGHCGVSTKGEVIAEMQDVIQQGVRICPSCFCLYCVGADVCQVCQHPLVFLLSCSQQLSPNLNSVYTCPKCSNQASQKAPFCDFCGRLLHIEFPYYYAHDYRPTIPIQLRSGGNTIKSIVLIDFGATHTILPFYLAAGIGVDLTNAKSIQATGVASGATITAYEALVEIGIAEKYYETQVFFSPDLPLSVFGLLGHVGFLDRFDVKPDNVKRRVVIKEHDVLREKLYQLCPSCGIERKNKLSQYCSQCGTSLIVPSQIVNGYVVPSLPINTTQAQPLNSVPSQAIQVASAMQI